MDAKDVLSPPPGGKSMPLQLAILASSIIVLYFLWSVFYNLFFHPLRTIPGPKLWAISPIFQAWAQCSGRGHIILLELHKKYGHAVRVGPNDVSFTSAQAWKDCNGHRTKGRAENLKHPAFFNNIPNSLIAADSERHRDGRRLLSHGFSQKSLIDQEPMIRGYINLLFERLAEHAKQGKPVNFVQWYNYTTFDVIGDLTFGESFGCLESSGMHTWVAMIFKQFKANHRIGQIIRAYPFMQNLINSATGIIATKAIREHRALVENKLKQRMSLEAPRHDFMHGMITPDKTGKLPMTYNEIADNSDVLIVAGSETTATTLCGLTSLLCAHPHVYEKMYQEVKTEFTSEDEINLVSVQKLSYMMAVIDEGLRIYPAAGGTSPRIIAKDGCIVDGKFLPGGTCVDIWHWTTYHDPSNFSQPESFIPERWLGDPRFDGDSKEAFQPFSTGGRNCMGKNLAYAEMKLILAKLVWNYNISLADEKDKDWVHGQEMFGLWNKKPLFIQITPREKS